MLIAKEFSKCRENGIACLRKGKLRHRLLKSKTCAHTSIWQNQTNTLNVFPSFAFRSSFGLRFVTYFYLFSSRVETVNSKIDHRLKTSRSFLFFPFFLFECVRYHCKTLLKICITDSETTRLSMWTSEIHVNKKSSQQSRLLNRLRDELRQCIHMNVVPGSTKNRNDGTEN